MRKQRYILDIDVDYDYAHKAEIIKSEADSNGIDHFAKIHTYTTLKAKGVLKDVCRVAGEPVSVGVKLSGFIPNEPKMTIQKALEQNPDFPIFLNNHPEFNTIMEIAKKLEGKKRSSSTHPCGHIPTPLPCEDLFPVSVDSKTGYLVCQYDMESVEKLGNLKKDLLMLRNLSIIDETNKLIKKEYNIDIGLWKDEILNDKKTLNMISRGDTAGVFQLESAGMQKFMKDLKPSCFEDIIAGVSLYRPGPMDYIPSYIEGKKHPKEIKYLTPELQDILKNTYGVIVYQEDVMKIVQKLAGFSMGRADLVRKAMGHKKMDIMEAERKNFIYGSEELGIKGCINNGISESIANQIYDQMIDFAKYAFNKSHAAAYAAISMQTAYLKCHYYKEFICGLLTSTIGKPDKMAYYIKECTEHKIKILPPDINKSDIFYTVEKAGVRYGLSAVKGVGEDIITQCIIERNNNGPYKNIIDVIERNPNLKTNAMTMLNHVGAFDKFGFTRCSIDTFINMDMNNMKKELKKENPNQMSLFDLDSCSKADKKKVEFQIKKYSEYPKDEIWKQEKYASGMYISGHPLNRYKDYMKSNVTLTSIDFKKEYTENLNDDSENFENISTISSNLDNGQQGVIGGMISSLKILYTKKDKKKMACFQIEDFFGTINCVIFPKSFEKYGDSLYEGAKILINGTVQIKDEDISFIAGEIAPLEDLHEQYCIIFDTVEDYNKSSDKLVLSNKYMGKNDIVYIIRDINQYKIEKHKISVSDESISEGKLLFGDKNIFIKDISVPVSNFL